jgi:hypothetical protein
LRAARAGRQRNEAPAQERVTPQRRTGIGRPADKPRRTLGFPVHPSGAMRVRAMTDEFWIPVASAVALLNSRHVSKAPKALRNTLNCCVDVRSRGVPVIDGAEPIALGPEHWSTMVFNLKRQSLDRPGKIRIATGFTKVELLRSDVERLADRLLVDVERFAAPTTIEPAVATANLRQSIDFDALLAFIKNHYATANERTNREKAKASAEEHFGRIIPTVAWRNAFAKAEINNNSGRPRTRPRNP